MYTSMLILSAIVFWLVYSICLPDHRHYTCSSLLPSTEVSIGYHTKVQYIMLSGMLLIPPILVVLIPLLLCPGLASIFDLVDLKTMSAVLTKLLSSFFILTILCSTFWCSLKHIAMIVSKLHSFYYISLIPCPAPIIWFFPATVDLSSHTCFMYAS
jgi:hypothetical protein